jgi:type IV pilus assembly protein PilB
MKVSDKKLYEILLSENYISPKDLDRAYALAARQNSALTQVLYEQKLTTKDILGQAMGEYYKIPFCDLSAQNVPEDALRMLPHALAEKHRAILWKASEDLWNIATDEPERIEQARKSLTSITSAQLQFSYAFAEDIDENLQKYQKTLNARFWLLSRKVTVLHLRFLIR